MLSSGYAHEHNKEGEPVMEERYTMVDGVGIHSRNSNPSSPRYLRNLTVFRVVSGCGQIGRISRTMATLETGQDPLYKASEHREDMLQHHEDTSQHREDKSQRRRENVAMS